MLVRVFHYVSSKRYDGELNSCVCVQKLISRERSVFSNFQRQRLIVNGTVTANCTVNGIDVLSTEIFNSLLMTSNVTVGMHTLKERIRKVRKYVYFR